MKKIILITVISVISLFMLIVVLLYISFFGEQDTTRVVYEGRMEETPSRFSHDEGLYGSSISIFPREDDQVLLIHEEDMYSILYPMYSVFPVFDRCGTIGVLPQHHAFSFDEKEDTFYGTISIVRWDPDDEDLRFCFPTGISDTTGEIKEEITVEGEVYSMRGHQWDSRELTFDGRELSVGIVGRHYISEYATGNTDELVISYNIKQATIDEYDKFREKIFKIIESLTTNVSYSLEQGG